MIETYINGSFPSDKTTQDEVDELKKLLFSSVTKTKEDFKKPDLFENFQQYTAKTTGFTMNNVLDALAFNNFHEGVHFGIMLQIKKFI